MDDHTNIETPNSLNALVDPTAALRAAERLYAACSQGIRHSGWHGVTMASSAGGGDALRMRHDAQDELDNH